jgi:hypothetical protein
MKSSEIELKSKSGKDNFTLKVVFPNGAWGEITGMDRGDLKEIKKMIDHCFHETDFKD